MNKVIKLFKAVPVEKLNTNGQPQIIGRFIFVPAVVNEYKNNLKSITKIVEKELILTADQMNSSFHKSWKKIKEADIEQLVYEQLVHYFTTYGFESMGIYDNDFVYVPTEKLKISKLNIDKIGLIVIKGITKEEITKRILKLLQSGIALKKETIQDLLDIIDYSKIVLGRNDIFLIKNKEMKMILQDKYEIIPDNPVEILRTIIYKLTGESLIIKSKELIEKLKIADKEFKLTPDTIKKLAEIFYRFKPLFLALKGNSILPCHINKIRKLAKKYHKPMKPDYLNNITNVEYVNVNHLKEKLLEVNIYRKIRLANALKFRKNGGTSIVYRIRNGKGYSTECKSSKLKNIKQVYRIVKEDIKNAVLKNVEGKKIYIPEYMNYALPSSEKQFSDNFPLGTCVKVKDSMIFGIYWKNIKQNRIDLDLSIISADGKYGWDGDYRNSTGSILFSGDMTDAQNGASELFYVQKNNPGTYLLMVNYFNYDKDIPVPFDLFVARTKDAKIKENYIVNPNNILAVVKTEIKRKQRLVGLIKITEGNCKFYFCETDIGMAITSTQNDYVKNCRIYLSEHYSNLLSLNKIIKDNLTNKDDCDIDLSPDNLSKDDIISIVKT